jgi:hypothetical protein
MPGHDETTNPFQVVREYPNARCIFGRALTPRFASITSQIFAGQGS